MKFVNLTPHKISIWISDEHGKIDIEPTAPPARIAQRDELIGFTEIEGWTIPLVKTYYGQVENLPEPIEDTVYITSALVAAIVKREDVVSPDTGPSAVREAGQIVAVRRLVMHA